MVSKPQLRGIRGLKWEVRDSATDKVLKRDLNYMDATAYAAAVHGYIAQKGKLGTRSLSKQVPEPPAPAPVPVFTRTRVR